MPTLITTDAVDTVLQRKAATFLRYTVYGHSPDNSGTAFAGVHLEQALFGYLLGHGYRLYMPALMRFNAADENSPFHAGGTNSYAYCQGDPVNSIDPEGTIAVAVMKAMTRIARLNISKPWTISSAARAIKRNKTFHRALGNTKRLRPLALDQAPTRPIQRVAGVPRYSVNPFTAAAIAGANPPPTYFRVESVYGEELQQLLNDWPRHRASPAFSTISSGRSPFSETPRQSPPPP